MLGHGKISFDWLDLVLIDLIGGLKSIALMSLTKYLLRRVLVSRSSQDGLELQRCYFSVAKTGLKEKCKLLVESLRPASVRKADPGNDAE